MLAKLLSEFVTAFAPIWRLLVANGLLPLVVIFVIAIGCLLYMNAGMRRD